MSDGNLPEREPRLTAEEVGPVEMYKVLQACEHFKSFRAAQWHAERYGRMAGNKIYLVKHDAQQGQQSNLTCDTARDAYNFARMAHNGWRALRGL